MRPRKKRNTFHCATRARPASATSIAPSTSTAVAPSSATVLSRMPRGRTRTPTSVSPRTKSASAPVRLVRVAPGELHVLDEPILGLEGPGAVVRELPRRTGQTTQHDRRSLGLVLADAAHERRGHPHQLPGAILALELAVAAGQLDLDVLGADAGGALGVPGLERVHECASGR